MCGICGIYDLSGGHGARTGNILAMRDIMLHRGPDEGGVQEWPGDRLFFGHRRLSIIDLSPNGRQPMANEDGSVVIIFNGEIYNFQDFRQMLESRGHVFRSNSDTEVLLHLYEEKGVRMLDDIEGMFAFAIWDDARKRLFIARDHLGIKPLYYYLKDGLLLFASEIKSIIGSGLDVDKELNAQAMRSYLQFAYIPKPHSIYRHIEKLDPGSYLLFENGVPKKQRYWDIPADRLDIGDSEALERHRDLFSGIVRRHMISDVPLGAFLSGGVDSTAVVSSMAEISEFPVSTFTIGFEKASNTMDVDLSRLVSERFDCSHHEYIMEPDISELFSELIPFFDEPFAVTSAIPLYLNSEFAGRRVKVVLTGDGADEVYGGYRRHKMYGMLEALGRMPGGASKACLGFAKAVLSAAKPTSKAGKFRDQIVKRLALAVSKGDPLMAYMTLHSFVGHDYPDRILNTGFREAAADNNESWRLMGRYFEAEGRERLFGLLRFDAMTSLVDEMLTKVDRMTMAHSIEARVPFLSHKLVEYVFALDGKLKIRGGEQKYLLKRSLAKSIPQQVINAPKRGFNLPMDQWLRHGLKEPLMDLTSSQSLVKVGIFEQAAVESMRDAHLSGKENHGPQLWAIMVLAKWLDETAHGRNVPAFSARASN